MSSLLRASTHYLTWVNTKNSNMIVAAAKSASRPVVSREKRLMFGMAAATPHPSIDLGQRLSSQKPRLSMPLFICRGKASWQRSSLNVQSCSMDLRRFPENKFWDDCRRFTQRKFDASAFREISQPDTISRPKFACLFWTIPNARSRKHFKRTSSSRMSGCGQTRTYTQVQFFRRIGMQRFLGDNC